MYTCAWKMIMHMCACGFARACVSVERGIYCTVHQSCARALFDTFYSLAPPAGFTNKVCSTINQRMI